MKQYLIPKLTLTLMLLIPTMVFAGTTYYVDSQNGNDANNGLSSSLAWKTIDKINQSWSIIQTGDDILFSRNSTFTGTQLAIRKGGTPSNSLIIGAYGSGNNPVFNTTDGAIRCYEDNLSYLTIRDISIKNISGGQGISINGDNISNVILSNIDIDNVPNYNGILLYKIDTYLIEDCEISNCGNSCIAIMGSSTYPITNGIIRNNIINNAIDGDGITLHRSSDHHVGANHELLNNICYNNREQGIDINCGNHITLRGNETYWNGDSGILVDKNANDIWIDRHYSHDENLMGIIINPSSNVKLTRSIISHAAYHSLTIDDCINFEGYNNTIIHSNGGSIIDIKLTSKNVIFKNNIITSTLNGSPNEYVRFRHGGTPNNIECHFSNNIWWNKSGNYSGLWWDEVAGSYGFDYWRSHYNQGKGSQFNDPILTSNYHLQAYSPAIDSGINVGLNSDFEGNRVPQGYSPDIGAFESAYAYTPPNASANASPSTGYSPLDVNFTASTSGGTSPYTYSWDFGDGSTSSDQNPSHTYSAANDYSAILTVTDNNDNQDTATITINVSEQSEPLQASASAAPSSGTAPLSVIFTGSASGGTSPYTYSWDFGDGSTSSEQSPSHTYSAANDYSAILTVTDNNDNQDTASLNISVSQQVVAMQATANASPTVGTIPFSVNFTADITGGVSPYAYSWDFGDGGSSSDQNPSHTYTSAGNITVILTVTDNLANEASGSVNISAAESILPLEASVNASPVSGIAPLAVSFTSNASGGVEPYTYSWDFGDGSSSTLKNPAHTFSQSGNFSATLTITDVEGSQDSDSVTISVSATTPETTLSVSSITGYPAPDSGGTTDPIPGNHNYPNGSSAQIEALANSNYRFAKWSGDVSTSQKYNRNISLAMNQDKNIQAHFYTRCGDVNGDLQVSPSDAQRVFEIFLGLIPEATVAQLENSDVNCDGTPENPKVTPSDAQAIFEKFLGISELPGDCSCKSRAATSQKETFEQINSYPGQEAVIKINDIILVPGEEVVVPIIFSGTYTLKAFGFDLSYPTGILEFICTESAPFSNNLTQIHANKIADGVIRAGGYSKKPISVNSEKTLINLVFKVRKNSDSPSSLQMINKFDDFQNITFEGGKLSFSENKKKK